MALPTPVLSDGDIVEVHRSSDESARLIWNTWSQDPTKVAVLQSILSCHARVLHYKDFHVVASVALGQKMVCPVHYSLLKGEEVHYLNVFRIPQKFMISSRP